MFCIKVENQRKKKAERETLLGECTDNKKMDAFLILKIIYLTSLPKILDKLTAHTKQVKKKKIVKLPSSSSLIFFRFSFINAFI